MGIGVRSFLVDDGGSVRRVPWCRMQKLFQGEPCAEFSHHAGKQVRCAIVFLEYHDRRPHKVVRTEFSVLYFDGEGSLDSEVQSQQLQLIGESLAPPPPPPDRKVVDIRPHIAKRVYRKKFEWTPTESELETIIEKCL